MPCIRSYALTERIVTLQDKFRMTDNNTALKKAGLKVTLPRLKILEVLQGPDNHHVSAEDLYKRLIDMGEEIVRHGLPRF